MADEERKEARSAAQLPSERASDTARSHETFVNSQKEATAAYAQAQTRAIHNKPTPPLLL